MNFFKIIFQLANAKVRDLLPTYVTLKVANASVTITSEDGLVNAANMASTIMLHALVNTKTKLFILDKLH